MLEGLQNLPWGAPPPGSAAAPVWHEGAFLVGEERASVLSYHPGSSNWTEELTSLHEELAAGGKHPIDLASRRHAIRQLRRHLGTQSRVLLEVGSSSGFMLADLRKAFPAATVVGSDVIRGPLERLAQQMPIPLLHFDLVGCPLPDACVDAAVLLNVLEHVKEDTAAIQQLFRILKPGGVAVIEVPAGPHLFDVYDQVLMHWRRYTMADLCRQLTSAGFEITHRSHLGFWLYPMFRRVKLRNARHLNDPPRVQRQIVRQSIRRTGSARLMRLALGFESFLGHWIRYPTGIRCVVTARKPTSTCSVDNSPA